jgi:uncharacterized protein (DUF3084 family)
METEKILSQNLSKLKEENTKTLNDYAILQKQSTELNELISRTSEESRKAKVELSEYENTRIANKLYEIEQKREIIEDLKKKIHSSEQEQIEDLNKQIETIKENIKTKNELLEKIEKGIKDTEQRYKEIGTLKEKIDFENEKSNILLTFRKEKQHRSFRFD